MEPSQNRYTMVMIVAQHGPDGKPFFGFISAIVTTHTEYEVKFHHKVAHEVMVEHGCAPEPMVFCDIEEWPEFIGIGALSTGRAGKLPAFEAKQHHYDQARAKANG